MLSKSPQNTDRELKETVLIGRRCQASLEMRRTSLGPLRFDDLPICGIVQGDLFGIRHPLDSGKVMTGLVVASLGDV